MYEFLRCSFELKVLELFSPQNFQKDISVTLNLSPLFFLFLLSFCFHPLSLSCCDSDFDPCVSHLQEEPRRVKVGENKSLTT